MPRDADPFEGVDAHVRPHWERSALLTIDVQRDFLDGGAAPIPGTTGVLPRIAELVRAYRDAGLPVVHVVRLYAGEDVDLVRRSAVAAGAPLVRPRSEGSQIAAALLPSAAAPLDAERLLAGDVQPLGGAEVAIWKPRWSAFHRTPLAEHLAALDVDTVVIAGCNYPNCPRATLYDASERDLRAVLASDAISRLAPAHLEEAREIGALAASARAIGECAAAAAR